MVCQQISRSEWPLLFFFFLGVWPPSPHAGMTSFPCRERQLLLWIQKFQNETVPEVKGYNFTPSCKQREADLLLPANDRHVRLGGKKKAFFFCFFFSVVCIEKSKPEKKDKILNVFIARVSDVVSRKCIRLWNIGRDRESYRLWLIVFRRKHLKRHQFLPSYMCIVSISTKYIITV